MKDEDLDLDGAPSAEEWDPHDYVPDEIDLITADGLAELHDELDEHNALRLRAMDPFDAGDMLWRLVDRGAISVELPGSRAGESA